jgi:hypothetical protein
MSTTCSLKKRQPPAGGLFKKCRAIPLKAFLVSWPDALQIALKVGWLFCASVDAASFGEFSSLALAAQRCEHLFYNFTSDGILHHLDGELHRGRTQIELGQKNRLPRGGIQYGVVFFSVMTALACLLALGGEPYTTDRNRPRRGLQLDFSLGLLARGDVQRNAHLYCLGQTKVSLMVKCCALGFRILAFWCSCISSRSWASSTWRSPTLFEPRGRLASHLSSAKIVWTASV